MITALSIALHAPILKSRLYRWISGDGARTLLDFLEEVALEVPGSSVQSPPPRPSSRATPGRLMDELSGMSGIQLMPREASSQMMAFIFEQVHHTRPEVCLLAPIGMTMGTGLAFKAQLHLY